MQPYTVEQPDTVEGDTDWEGTPPCQRMGLGLVCLLICVGFVGSAWGVEPVDIAVISDGGSALTEETRAALIDELMDFDDFELTFRFPAQWQKVHGWRIDGARDAIEAALADDSIELVIALDILSSSIASDFVPNKPLIAATVIHSQLQGFSVTEAGTSGTNNLHFLTANFDLSEALENFQHHTGARHMALLVDASIFAAIPALSEVASQTRDGLDFELSLVEQTSLDIEGWLSTLPPGVDALFLTPLPRLGRSHYDRLFEFAQAERWPTFTTRGRAGVEAGSLMGRSLVPTPKQLARRLAIDIRDIALGRPTSTLPVVMESRHRLVINRSTASSIGFQPSFELLFNADPVGEVQPEGRLLTLHSAVDEAVERNLRLAVSKADLEISRDDTRVARGALLPQLSGDVSWSRQDRDLVGDNPTRTTEVSLSLSQSIYSETLRSQYRATAWTETARVADLEAVELDVIETAALTYLRVLVAKTELDIQIENLNLTRANLERARFRYDVGSTNRSEVFRFEAELGTDQRNVTNAVAAHDRQRFELNRVLRQPLGLAFRMEESSIDTPKIFGDDRLARFLQGPGGVEILGAFLAAESLRNAPELAAIRARIAAQERLLLAAKRQRYVPSIDAFSRAQRIVEDGGALFETDFDEDWSLGVELTWSLFEGGGIQAKRRRADIQLQQLELTLEQTADLIEADARGDLVEAASSRLNIGFAEASAEAALQTLNLVTDAYVRGVANYIDLIDAQNTHLNARLAAANAVYQHLQDLVALQRSVGFFDFAVSPTEQAAWLDRFDQFIHSREDARQ